jgi:hypothetical protein
MASVKTSSTYNRTRSETAQSLYDVMIKTGNSSEVLTRYLTIIKNMSTVNPYTDILTNPRADEIDQAQTEIDELLEQIYEDSIYPTWVAAELEQVKTYLVDYKTHTSRLIANFPTFSSIVQSEIANSIDSISDNPCNQFLETMGSIFNIGQTTMDNILTSVAEIQTKMGTVDTSFKNAIATLKSNAAQANSQVVSEQEALADAMANQAKMNLAQLLEHTITDPCLESFVPYIITAQAKTILLNETENDTDETSSDGETT